MRPAIDLRKVDHQVALRDVADQQHVECAVVRLRVGRDLHAAAEVAAVGDDHVVHRAAPLLVADLDRDLRVPPAREDGHRAPGVRDLAAERLAGLVHTLGDRAAHARASRVREPLRLLAALPGAVARAPEVDRPRGRSAGDVERSLELVRDPERADEVAAGAAVHDRELHPVDPCDPVHDLVHRAVPADGDQQAGALRRGLARELCELLGPLRDERVAGQAALAGEPGDLRPALAGRPVVRGRIDEENSFA